MAHVQWRLDVSSGREVVFCHNCTSEWYRDGEDLRCSACGSEITEIVNLENDPRNAIYNMANRYRLARESRARNLGSHDHVTFYDSPSDPDEVDIEEHFGPDGFVQRRSIRRTPYRRDHHDPGMDNVMTTFREMVQRFSRETREYSESGNNAGRRPNSSTFHAHFITGDGGSASASVTIVAGPASSRQRGQGHPGRVPEDSFQHVFSSIIDDVSPAHNPARREDDVHDGRRFIHRDPPSRRPRVFPQSLYDIWNVGNPIDSVTGEPVFSEEALAEIMSGLLEAENRPEGTPTSDRTLQSLARRTVDDAMFADQSQTQCPICIESVRQGDTAAFLRCNHWFHEACVLLWLEEHNTCPICRAPVEEAGSENDQDGARVRSSTAPTVASGHEGSGVPPSSHADVSRSPINTSHRRLHQESRETLNGSAAPAASRHPTSSAQDAGRTSVATEQSRGTPSPSPSQGAGVASITQQGMPSNDGPSARRAEDGRYWIPHRTYYQPTSTIEEDELRPHQGTITRHTRFYP